jgi:sarcosine oxidase delta subunit
MKQRRHDRIKSEYLELTSAERLDIRDSLKSNAANIRLKLTSLKNEDVIDTELVKKLGSTLLSINLRLTIIDPMVKEDNRIKTFLLHKEAKEKPTQNYKHIDLCAIFVDLARNELSENEFIRIMKMAKEEQQKEKLLLEKVNQQQTGERNERNYNN